MTAAKERNPKFVWQSAFESSGLTPSAGFVGYVLANRDNGDGQGFYASAQSIAEATGYTSRTVQRALAALLDSGWIVQERKGGRNADGTNRASTYTLAIPSGATPVSRRSSEIPSEPGTLASPVTRDATAVSRCPDRGDTSVVLVDQHLSRPVLDPSSQITSGAGTVAEVDTEVDPTSSDPSSEAATQLRSPVSGSGGSGERRRPLAGRPSGAEVASRWTSRRPRDD